MATFLSNLPSYNKDNFSRFQPNSNKYQQKQSFMTSSKECPSEQIIVNQRCNLIIQYLERQSRERLLQAQQQQNENDRGNKRELNQVFKKRAESVTAETEFNSKFLKKRRISSTSSTTSSNQDQTSAGDSNLIEIDDTNHNSVKLF
jgi:hypothetical protein